MRLRYTPEAIADLRAIKSYIAKNLRNPKAAARITGGILDSCARLKELPQLGMSLSAKLGMETELRYLLWENYLAFYRVEDDQIQVIRILDGRSDYLRVLFRE